MRTHHPKTILALASIILFFTSCTMEKRVYMPGYYTDWLSNTHTGDKQALLINKNGKPFDSNNIDITDKTNTFIITQPKSNDIILASNNNFVIPILPPHVSFHKKEKNKKKQLPADQKTVDNTTLSEECDTLVLFSGQKIVCQVIEIGQYYKIKYKSCDDLNGPALEINQTDVHTINYHDGTRKMISSVSKQNPNKNKKSIIFGLMGLLIGIAGLFYYTLLAGIIAIALGLASLIVINNNPEKYSGTGWAVLSLFMGILDFILLLLALSLI